MGMSQTPDLTQVNTMLAKQAWLNGIQLRVVDQTITREFADGTSTSGNPFENSRLILSETERLGSTQYDILAESNDLILRAERSHTVVSLSLKSLSDRLTLCPCLTPFTATSTSRLTQKSGSMTVIDALRTMTAYPVPDAVLNRVLLRRGLSAADEMTADTITHSTPRTHSDIAVM